MGERLTKERRWWKMAWLCLALAFTLTLPALVLFVLLPADVSLLVEPEGNTRWYFNRQFDLPTGDPAVFHDCSLAPLLWCFAACALFYYVAFHFLVKRLP